MNNLIFSINLTQILNLQYSPDCGTDILIIPQNGYFDQNFDSNMKKPQALLKEINFFEKSLKSFFDREWTEFEIENNFIFGHLNHAENCARIFILSQAYKDPLENTLSKILWDKWARISFDYFIFCSNIMLPSSLTFSNMVKIANDKKIIVQYASKRIVKNRDFKIAAYAYDAHFLGLDSEQVKGQKARGHGPHFKIIENLSEKYNFTYQFISSGGTGTRHPNSTWTGTIGMILNKKVDFGLDLGTSDLRIRAIDGTTVYEYTRLTFIQTRSLTKYRWQVIFYTFEPYTWLIVFLNMATIVLVSPLFFKNSKKYLKNLNFSLDLVVRGILEQDWPNSVMTNSNSKFHRGLKILFNFWLFGNLVIGVAYKSKLFSVLGFPREVKGPENFRQLSEVSSGHKIHFRLFGGVAFNFFKTSKYSYHQRLLKRFLIEKDTGICIEKIIIQDEASCIIYVEAALVKIAKEFTIKSKSLANGASPFLTSKEFELLVPLIWAFPKGSPCTRIFSDFLQIFQSSGLFSYWFKKGLGEWEKESSRRYAQDELSEVQKIVKKRLEEFYKIKENKAKPFSVENLIGIFLTYCFGIGVSVFVHFLENFAEIFILKEKQIMVRKGKLKILQNSSSMFSL